MVENPESGGIVVLSYGVKSMEKPRTFRAEMRKTASSIPKGKKIRSKQSAFHTYSAMIPVSLLVYVPGWEATHEGSYHEGGSQRRMIDQVEDLPPFASIGG